MDAAINREAKKKVMKDIILKLHAGMPAEEAKQCFDREIGNITSTEIADIEQSLINDGLSPEEIKKFCNVHALIFQSALEKVSQGEVFPSHPVALFKQENREIEKITAEIKANIEKRQSLDIASFKHVLKKQLENLHGIDTHYERKEQLLFPFLEKAGFMGPSKVMWGKDNEVRGLLKKAIADLETLTGPQDFTRYQATLNQMLEEINGMIFKEENILFPTSLEKLATSDWIQILRESDQIGYVLIRKPEETDVLVEKLQSALAEEVTFQDGSINLPSGSIRLSEVMPFLNTLPVDITFVDSDDKVRYFSEGKERIFSRPRSVIGRNVRNCHPPQSLDVVEGILKSFKDGKRDTYDFWINFKGKLIYIRYLALRNHKGQYLGTLEVTQDITGIKRLEGEKRLVDERA